MLRPGSAWEVAAGKARVIIALATLVVVAVLVVFAAQLHSTQSATRRDVASRFHDRAAVAAALTQAIFSSAAASSDAAQEYGTATVGDRALDAAVKREHLEYAALFDERGTIIARSHGLKKQELSALSSRSVARRLALRRARFSISDVIPTQVIEFAVPFETPYGPRVLVSGFTPRLIGAFMGSYLHRIPSSRGTAYVIDSHGNVLGTPGPHVPLGRPVAESGLRTSLQKGASRGSFGPDGYFVAVPVPNSTWRVVLTASRSSLFTSVSGLRKWVPWLIFAAFGAVAFVSLLLLSRLLRSAAALTKSNRELATSNAHLEVNNSLLRNAAELARSNAELEQFASIASHDLQEPLRKVQTFAAQLNLRERDRLSEEGRDFLRRMTDASSRMRALIDDLLMFSRVSTQGRPFVPVKLGEVVGEVLPDLELPIEESRARLTIGELPTVAADPVQMRQLFQNLLANALKFRREGVVPEVRVEATVANGIAEVTVSDNGIGFEPKYASRIFRAFERLHGGGAYPGTGIGLALCRKIVERHDGTIEAHSSPGNGASFQVKLPVEHSEDMPRKPRSVFPDPVLEDAAPEGAADVHA